MLEEQEELQNTRLQNTRFQTVWSMFVLLVFPLIIFILSNSICYNPFVHINPSLFWLNYVLYLVPVIIMFFIFGRVDIPICIETVFAVGFSTLDYTVLQNRGLPIQPWDIVSVKTAMNVSGNVEFSLPLYVVLLILASFVLIGIGFTCKYKIRRKYVLVRILGAIASIILMVALGCAMNTSYVVKHFHVYPFMFQPEAMTRRNGIMYTYLYEMNFMNVKKPGGYKKSNIENEIGIYTEMAEKRKEAIEKKEHHPNIIVVMDESFADMSVLGELKTNEDYMPYLHELMEGHENTISGYASSSVLGGNTPNSEFEFLTGNTMTFLPTGSVPYQQYLNDDVKSLVSQLEDEGYETVAMHPYFSSGWKREEIYPMMGFDEYYFVEDLPSYKVVRGYPSDDFCVNWIIDQYKEHRGGKPNFTFVVTMQNRSSYSKEFDNFKPDVTVEGLEDDFCLSSYLSLIKLSDQAIEKLIHYFENADEDTIIVVFGDHQPNDTISSPIFEANGIDPENLSKEDVNHQYMVPYVIWANYDIEEQDHLDTSINYLSMMMLEQTDVPLTEYQLLLEEVKEDYPVVSAEKVLDKDGNSVSYTTKKDILRDYWQWEYYQLFDQKKK